MELAEALRNAGPWGHHFPEPLFEGRFHLLQQRIVGQRHLKLVVMPEGGAQALDAIAFNVDTLRWPNESVQKLRLVYRLDVNEFRGQRTLQLMVDQLQPC
jgi:single-stranded-DNA-specific exonuclease